LVARILLIFALLICVSSASAEEIVLFGAGSLREAITAIAADYTKATGVAVRTQFGPSGLMRVKVEAGVDKVDLFASADMGQALKLRQDGFAVSVVMFARNRLCAFATPDVALTAANFAERLVDPKVKLGTSTPKADPGGDYTWKMFELIDKARPGAFAILDGKAQKIIGGSPSPAPDPDPIAAAFRRGQINVMIGYCSGASRMRADAPGVEPVPVPEAFAVGPEYGLAITSYANPAAVALAFAILSPEGQAKLESFGFAPIGMISGR
jgi:molybdate transport system substrate-binding protein